LIISPGLYNYWIVIVLMMVGFYTVISRGNLIKKIIGLNVFQVSVFMLYISMGKVDGGIAPILVEPMPEHGEVDQHAPQNEHSPAHDEYAEGIISDEEIAQQLTSGEHHGLPAMPKEKHKSDVAAVRKYSNPLPHVLILTAIVVGVATTSLGLALVVRINEAYGTIEEDQILRQDDDS